MLVLKAEIQKSQPNQLLAGFYFTKMIQLNDLKGNLIQQKGTYEAYLYKQNC